MLRLVICRGWAVLALLASTTAFADDAGPAGTETVSQGLAAYMQKAADEGFTGAVIVARGDEVLLHAGYGERIPGSRDPVTTDTVSTIGSITKQFTAAAIMLLQQEGALAVGDTLDMWFDDVPQDKASITIHQLLSHQAGLPPAIGPDNERIGRQAWLQRALESELLFPPGTGYEYSNVGFGIAAAIIEMASGEEYEAFLRDKFFTPLGMDDTGYHLSGDAIGRLAHGRDRDGSDWGSVYRNFIADGGPGWHLVGNGGIHSTPADMLRWHRALQDNAILDAASTAALYGRYAEEPGGSWYGYGWSSADTPWGARLVTHNGGNTVFFADYLRFPDDDIVVFLWTTSREARLMAIGEPLARIVYGEPAPDIAPPPPPLAPVETDTAVGQLAARMVALLADDDTAAGTPTIVELAHPDLVDKHGADKLAEITAMIREELGDAQLLGMRLYGDERVDLEFETVQGVMAIELGLQDSQGPKIHSIGLRLGQ